MSKQLRLDVAQLTDVGRKRPHNEDNMAYVIPKDEQVMARKGALFIVADGMGGHAAGEVASEIAVDTVTVEYYKDEGEDILLSLKNAIKRANTIIHQRAAENMLRSGMGTTCVSAVLRGNVAYVANVGDSRAYMVRQGQVRQISQDHSWVEEQVRAGLLTRDQARSHAQRNVITRCLGTQAEVEVDVFSEILEEGDSLILCTDGLSGAVVEDDLRAIVEKYLPQESVYHLVERANENGGSDNITAIVVRVQELGVPEPANNTTLQLVPVGGSGENEDTIVLGRASNSPTGSLARTDESALSSSPLRSSGTGPLFSSGNTMTAPLAAVAPVRHKRGRLLYPTLALLVILLVALAGGGAYYFLYLQRDVNYRLDQIANLIQRADPAKDSSAALKDLFEAQKQLHSMSGAVLVGPQSTRTMALREDLAEKARETITSYNRQHNIVAPSATCSVTEPQTIAATENRKPDSLAMIQAENTQKVFSYVLMSEGESFSLQRLNTENNTMEQKHSFDNAVPLLIAGQGQRLFVLTRQSSPGAPVYMIHVLKANPDGSLGTIDGLDPRTLPPDTLFSENNRQPRLMTSWGDEAYIVFHSPDGPQDVILLRYSLSAWGGENGKAPEKSQATVSFVPRSVVALPDNRLLMLTADGTIQRFTFDSQKNSQAQQFQLHNAIPTPVGVDVDTFETWNTPFSVPENSGTQSQTFQITEATHLAIGDIDGKMNLFVIDDKHNRVVQILYPTDTAQSSPTATPDVESTATAVPTTAPDVGGNNIPRPEYVRQYASNELFPAVKGVAVDPVSEQVHVLTQSDKESAMLNAIDTQKASSCLSSS